jgi:hypothetical protein
MAKSIAAFLLRRRAPRKRIESCPESAGPIVSRGESRRGAGAEEKNYMANFLYIFRGGMDPNASPQQMQEQMQKWGAWIQALTRNGSFKAGDPLDRGGRVLKGKKKVVTDGPFAEAKDLVGGYLLVSAKDLDEATDLARGCPIFESDAGTVEVRQVQEMRT